MQLVGRLEGGHLSTRSAVGEQQRLQHLVGTVGDEDLLAADAVGRADGVAQLSGRSVGIAVPLDPGHLGGERVAPGGGRRRRAIRWC